MTDNLLLYMDPDGRVNDMILGPGGEEKGAYGLGLYTMAKSVLMRLISAAVSRNRMHFERDVLQRHVDTLRIYGYEVPEYTAVICSLNSYFQANMDLLDPGVRAALFPSRRPIYTKVRDCAPAVYGPARHGQGFPGGRRQQNRRLGQPLHHLPGCADRAGCGAGELHCDAGLGHLQKFPPRRRYHG